MDRFDARQYYPQISHFFLSVLQLQPVSLVTIICLAIGMAIMLVTSVLVSRDLFPFTALSGAFAVREIHMFAGYWVLLIVAVHLGTRWAW